MRIEVTLENPRREIVIPVNYNQFLASCIYRTLEASSSEYSSFLHSEGYQFQGKKFKLFTFSQILAMHRSIRGELLFIRSPEIRWLVSSPIDEFVMHFANGILERGVVQVGEVAFRVNQVSALPIPDFTSSMHFTCLSPITMSTHIDTPGLHPTQYCRLEDNFYEKVVENLRRKYELLTGKDATSLALKMEFDRDYIDKRDGRITKKIRYKGIEIIGYLAPFRVEGNLELIRVGYETGFGDKNSNGMGMVEVGDFLKQKEVNNDRI